MNIPLSKYFMEVELSSETIRQTWEMSKSSYLAPLYYPIQQNFVRMGPFNELQSIYPFHKINKVIFKEEPI